MTADTLSRPLIGVGVLVWKKQQLLLGERLSHTQNQSQTDVRCWQFPGGHLENGESVIECARREVMEETGLSVKHLRHLGFTDKQFRVAQSNYITLLVSCEFDSGEVEILEPDKCARWQWFDYQKLPDPLFVAIPSFLSQLSQSLTSDNDLYALHNAARVLPEVPAGERR
jgi:8-oxo-dGTP diphosphatase